MATKRPYPWTVESVAVDEPGEGESGTIYEYHVKESHRTICTVHYKDEAESIARDHNTAPGLLSALVALVEWLDVNGMSRTKAGGVGVFKYEGTEYEEVTKARAEIARAQEIK